MKLNEIARKILHDELPVNMANAIYGARVEEHVLRAMEKYAAHKIQNIGSELGVLDSQADSNGVYSHVAKSHAECADSTEDSENTSAGRLPKIIDDGNLVPDPCEYCGKQIENPKWRVCDECYYAHTWD